MIYIAGLLLAFIVYLSIAIAVQVTVAIVNKSAFRLTSEVVALSAGAGALLVVMHHVA